MRGDRYEIAAPGMSERATCLLITLTQGGTAFVQLDGTDELVSVPQEWLVPIV